MEPVNATALGDGHDRQTVPRTKLQCIADAEGQRLSKLGVCAKQASDNFMCGKFANMGLGAAANASGTWRQLVHKYWNKLAESGEAAAQSNLQALLAAGDLEDLLGEPAQEVKAAGAKLGCKRK